VKPKKMRNQEIIKIIIKFNVLKKRKFETTIRHIRLIIEMIKEMISTKMIFLFCW